MAILTNPKDARQKAQVMNRSSKIVKKIRERYSVDEEFAIQRKYMLVMAGFPMAQDKREKIMGEFSSYCKYVEECKNIVDDCKPF